MLLILGVLNGSANHDTLHVQIHGKFTKNETFFVLYKGSKIGQLSKHNNTLSTTILIDTNQCSPYDLIDLQIYKVKRVNGQLEPVRIPIVYDPINNHIQIFRFPKKEYRYYSDFLIYYLPFERPILRPPH